MTEPTGYTAVGMVGFTDKGTYSASATYVKNDLVHYGGSIWCCLIDDTTGITPTEGVNWRFWVENSQEGISDIVNILGAKNLLKISMKTTSSRGITVTNNGDSSITVSGTATETAYFNLTEHDFGDIRFSTEGSADNSNYILSGLPSNNNFYIAYNPSTKCITLAVKPAYGAVDNVTVYPMIRPKNIEDATWQPYTKTNKELTAEVTQNSSDIQTLANKISNSSDEYDSTKAYYYGDLVIHDNVLYRCRTACTAASWAVNSSCFTATSITSELSKVNEYSSVTVTPDSFPKLYSGLVFQKCGRVVDVTIQGFKDLTAKDTNVMTDIIPVGFRPISGMVYNIIGTANGEVYRVRFETNGTMMVYPYTTTEAQNNVRNTISYLS